MQEVTSFDSSLLPDLMITRMPFGKYEGVLLYMLPVSYLEWFNNSGFPKGRLGHLLQLIFLIKTNGLMHLLEPLKVYRK